MKASNITNFKSRLQFLKKRLTNRPDTEHEQAFFRVAITVLVLFYLSGLSLFGTPSESVVHGLIILSLFLFFSLTMIAAIILNPGISITRRIVCMVGDMSVISYLHYHYGETTAPFYIIYLWVSSGYGLRYGNRYLAAATALAAIGFFMVVRYNKDWRDAQNMGWGLLIGLVVLPMYIASLLAKLSRALEAAEEANTAKSRFLANISHEIRTPINGVIGLLELLNNTLLTDKQRSMVNGAQSSAATLHHLIENVLDISKIEAESLVMTNELFDLHAMVNGVVGLFEYAALDKRLELIRRIESQVPSHVYGDEFRLRQVLVNLVGNAIKFTNEGRVEVQLCVVEKTEEYATLKLLVSDTGIGISEEAQAFIFEPFRQEDERITRHFGGTGLGMSIAKQLIGLMGGTIKVASVAGIGSTFTVNIGLKYANNTAIKALRYPGGVKIISQKPHIITRVRECLKEWAVECTVDTRLGISVNESAVIVDEDVIPDTTLLFAQYPNLRNRDVILYSEHRSENDAWKYGYSACVTDLNNLELLYTVMHSLQRSTFDFDEHKHGITEQGGNTARILVADDNRVNQEVTRSFLEQAGHTVSVFSDGQSALDALTSSDYDLAIIDMMMPGQSGLDVIKLYRHVTGNRELPFIILTANVSADSRKSVESIGAKYLTKPLRGIQLQKSVDEILGQRISSNRADTDSGSDNHKIFQLPVSESNLIDDSTFSELVTLLGKGPRLIKLVDDFCHDTESLLCEMRQAYREHDWLRASDIAHGIKGSSYGIGAIELAREARELESEMLKPKPLEVAERLMRLESAYGAVQQTLKKRTAPITDSGGVI
jgi:two-component system, sensor histidine kinase RpfC